MGVKTNIPWCHSTWNFSRGCDKVSPGCLNCYITDSLAFRFTGMKHGDPRVTASDATFNAPLAWNKKPWACDICGGFLADRDYCPKCQSTTIVHRRRVFSLSLGDWLDPKIDVSVLARALDIIRRCSDIDLLLCTKRPELFERRLLDALVSVSDDCGVEECESEESNLMKWIDRWLDGDPPRNVWILTSVEDQQRANERIPELLKIPAVVRGLSCEPLLGPLNLCGPFDGPQAFPLGMGIGWVIAGGESGKNARPCNVDWIRSINDQCSVAGVPCFVKQLGSMPFYSVGSHEGECVHKLKLQHPKGGEPFEWPGDLRVRQFPEVAR